MKEEMKTAVYPGSFDPVTIGHLDIIERAAKQFDKLVIGVLQNDAKHPLFSVQERVEMLTEVTAGIENITVCSFEGLLVDFARQEQASVIVRGLRAVTDFEYEVQLAQANYRLYDGADTVFFASSPQYGYISSSAAREVAHYGGDLSLFVPQQVKEKVYSKYHGLENHD